MTSSVDNLFARDGFWWWVGVVEDRMDPLKIGRVRVRITGYHISNKRELPTDDLPWALPMQPILSAAISGKGTTPLGPLEGTWVVGFFADGAECQQPIIMGTLGGIPNTSNACSARAKEEASVSNVARDDAGNVVTDQNGDAVENSPQPVTIDETSSNSIYLTLPPLSQSEIQNLMTAIGQRESGSQPGGAQNYTTTNQYGYVGKYQFGAAALQDAGYLRTPIPKSNLSNSDMDTTTLWTGKNGVESLEDFKANKNNVQELAMFENVKTNYVRLKNLGVIDASTSTKEEVAGYLATSHLLGAGGARDYSQGVNKTDGNGTGASEYYALGVGSLGGVVSNTPRAIAQSSTPKSGLNKVVDTFLSWAGPLNNPKLGQPEAYGDPNSVYPRCDYTARPDTNKLATNTDNLKTTPNPEKEKTRIESVKTANEATPEWQEPPSAFNAKYPYNHVKETESGHVIELDDTPNAERIHIYHRTGTYVEIDREGSVSYKVKGENYEIFNRNNRMYIQGNHDVTVDGAKTLLVKNALDVEVLGKATINIKNDADVNISGTLNLKAQNINIEAQQDINIRSGNYTNFLTGGDLNYRVGGDEQHLVAGDYDLDASDINLNSGTANPTAASETGLGNGIQSDLYGSTLSAFDVTGLNPLPVDIANTLNPIAKVIPNVTGKIGSNLLGGVFSAGGVAGILSNTGVPGLNTVLAKSGIGNFIEILRDTGFTNIDGFSDVINQTGFKGINEILSFQGLGDVESILAKAGLNVDSAFGDVVTQTQEGILSALQKSGLVPDSFSEQTKAIIDNFVNNGVSRVDDIIPVLKGTLPVFNEFGSWTDFPDSTQLSKYFTLGDLTNRVREVGMQFPLTETVGYTKDILATNLKSLAVNALDPIKEAYPNAVISNAFMPTTGYLISNDPYNPVAKFIDSIRQNVSEDIANSVERDLNTVNQFNVGRAANIQFKGATASEYFEIAQWMKENIAYDQIRLEYSTLGTSEPWITVSHRVEGNRPIESIDKIVTAVNGTVIANYLADLSDV